MGSVFPRKSSKYWWIAFVDWTGRRRQISSERTNKEDAERVLEAIERKISAQRAQGLGGKETLTLERYVTKWLAERRKRGLACVNDDEDRLAHALPVVGHLALEEIKPRHVRDLVRGLMAKQKLAPRTIRHVYGVLRVLFSDAVTEELLDTSPCVLRERRGELPKKIDKDPAWRATAVFARDEVEQLISDERIPQYRRVLYGLMFLGGMRVNEALARRWRDWDSQARPLGRLQVSSSYVRKARREKPATKTGAVRAVPVHPTLAALLGAWKLAKHREPNELILPSPETKGTGFLNSNTTLARFHEDCKLLGLRTRRQHDARRTFVSLGIADGARKDILRWVSHGPVGDIVDLYTTLPWQTLCEEVAKLKIRLLEGALLPLGWPQGSNSSATSLRGV
jgi:integrase